jgi:hypothetical protein
MRLSSSSPVSITLTAPTSEAGDSGSDTAQETRSLRHHIRLRTSSPASRKSLLSLTANANGVADHTETTTRRRTRSRGLSGSSLLKNNLKSEEIPSPTAAPQTSVQGTEAGEGATGPGFFGSSGSADNPSPSSTSHYTIVPVDQSFVSPITLLLISLIFFTWYLTAIMPEITMSSF